MTHKKNREKCKLNEISVGNWEKLGDGIAKASLASHPPLKVGSDNITHDVPSFGNLSSFF